MARMVRITALGVLAALAALAFTACGEPEEGVSGPQKAQAVRADAVCEETQDKVGTLADDAAADRDAVRAAAERFHSFNPPSEDETIWKRFVTEADNLWLSLEDVAQARDPSTNERARADRAVVRARDTNARLADMAEEYGMTTCANGGLAEA